MPIIAREEIETPLGILWTGIDVVEKAENIRASCVVEDHFPKLTRCFGVDAIRRASWKIELIGDVPGLRLFLLWRPGYSWERHFRCGGQHFESQMYIADDCTVNIGCYEDCILLTHAVRDNGSLPKRFASYCEKIDRILDALASNEASEVEEVEDIEWLQFKPEGLSVELPALRKGETVCVHLTASWFSGKYANGRGQTTFAADAALEGDIPWDER